VETEGMARALLSGLEAKAFASLMRALNLHLLPHLMRQSLSNLRSKGVLSRMPPCYPMS